MSSSYPLSENAELAYLVAPIRAVTDAATQLGVDTLVVGAVARDIAYAQRGLPAPRATADIDLAVAVSGWAEYESLRRQFPSDPSLPDHRLRTNGALVDLVPFGGVENARREIAWPPRGDNVMSVFGFAEARAHALMADFGGGVSAPVASIPGLAALKVVAWSDRHFDRTTDGLDLKHLMRDYGEHWQYDRIYGDDADLLEQFDFDPVIAGAALLGRDVGRMFEAADRGRLVEILSPHVAGDSYLVRDMGLDDRDRNLELLTAFWAGITSA